jgi:hypothetical protein
MPQGAPRPCGTPIRSSSPVAACCNPALLCVRFMARSLSTMSAGSIPMNTNTSRSRYRIVRAPQPLLLDEHRQHRPRAYVEQLADLFRVQETIAHRRPSSPTSPHVITSSAESHGLTSPLYHTQLRAHDGELASLNTSKRHRKERNVRPLRLGQPHFDVLSVLGTVSPGGCTVYSTEERGGDSAGVSLSSFSEAVLQKLLYAVGQHTDTSPEGMAPQGATSLQRSGPHPGQVGSGVAEDGTRTRKGPDTTAGTDRTPRPTLQKAPACAKRCRGRRLHCRSASGPG